MASIRRTDSIHKSFSKGRPAKTDRERNKRRQEAYRWRDARRIYLANSFDKWRKLRSSLGLKDSGLAWHLMEAHEKGQCGICRRSKEADDAESKNPASQPAVQEFLPSLLDSLRSLCYTHFQFEDCIKIVGQLCLEFDSEKKENFNVNEIVSSKLIHLDIKNKCNGSDDVLSSSFQVKEGQNTASSGGSLLPEDISIGMTPETSPDIHFNDDTPEEQEVLHSCVSDKTVNASHVTNHTDHGDADELDCENSSDKTERAFRMEGDEGNTDERKRKACEMQYLSDCQTNPSANHSSDQSLLPRERQNFGPFLSVDSVQSSVSRNESLISNSSIKTAAILKPEENFETPSSDQSISVNDASIELPLDMSLIKTEPSIVPDVAPFVFPPGRDYDEKQTNPITYPKIKMIADHEIRQPERFDPPASRDLSKSRLKPRDTESAPSIPWQRRDMSRKEEYEFLEMNPFSDLTEFSLRYPHVHQRTYYRWKRRIKEEYIILEQCPDMTFEQFSSVVLQAKEAVFSLWKGLIAQGRGFFAPSDLASKKVETKSLTPKPVSNFNVEYLYLQRNVSITQEQFCRKFPNIPPDVFNVLQRKAMQEFSLFLQNQQLTWEEFSKILNVSEETYNSWREHVETMRLITSSSDRKIAPGDFSPNGQVFSSSYSPFLESPPPAESNLQLSKDGMQKSILDPYGSQPRQLDPALKSSVSGNLSSNYLNSLQNMMLPWASYYNLAPSLGQQMFPMMLWPRMLGLSPGLAGPMNISSLMSDTSCATSVNMTKDVSINTSRGHIPPQLARDPSENFAFPKSDKASSKCSTLKRPSSDGAQDRNGVHDNESIKKQKTKEDWDGGSSPYSRSRKQNKQEYVYYLTNPELCFKDLETLFPTISVRTFYRWRKEMNAAVLFIEDNRDLDYQQFKIVFPDIPEDIFDGWKTKSGKMSSSNSAPYDRDSARDNHIIHQAFDSKEGKDAERGEDSHRCADDSSKSEYEMSDILPVRDGSLSAGGESSHARKVCKAAHLFVHQNPDIEFGSFAQVFPNVSVRSFYRWKKEWKDATDFLQTNPEINYETYKSVDASISKEIFDSWKVSVFSKSKNEEINTLIPQEERRDSKANSHCNRKHNGPEFAYLQLNPHIDFSQFSHVYPDVPSRTFYRWKREIQHILNYVRAQPNIDFSDISSVLPGVSEEALLRWKELISQGVEESSDLPENRECLSVTTNSVDEEAKSRMTKALLHLMNNPNMAYSDFHEIYDFVSPETFQMWLHRVKLFVLHVSSNPSLNYDEFSSAFCDIEEDTFMRWKSLTPEEISAIGTEGHNSMDMLGASESCDTSEDVKDAMYYCQQNPQVTFDVFSKKYVNISKARFKQWMLKISDQIAFIKDNPGLTFEDFNKVFEDVRETVFESWKQDPFPYNSSPLLTKEESSKSGDHLFGDGETSHEKDFLSDRNTLSPFSVTSQLASSKQGHSGNEKENENASAESSLSKLTKFAESDVSLYTRWTSEHNSEEIISSDNSGKVVIEHDISSIGMKNDQRPESLDKSDRDSYIDNNNVTFNGLHNTDGSRPENSIDSIHKLLNPLSTNISVNEVCSSSPEMNKSPFRYKHDTDDHNTAGYRYLASENKSLSALMVMSTNKTQLPLLSPTFKQEIGTTESCNSSSSGSCMPSQMGSKDDDEIFSSQRQKKMSRAEYLFVKDNPDVDSQEFARIFPGVSARTFYRWKKEIKAQIPIP